MTSKRRTVPDVVLPDANDVEQRAFDALATLKAAQQQLHQEAAELDERQDRIDADRKKLADGQAELERGRKDLDAERVKLAAMTSEIERERADIEASQQRFEQDRLAVEAQREEIEVLAIRLGEQQQAHSATEASLVERSGVVEEAERRINEQASQLAAQRAAFEQREEEVKAREADAERMAAELADTRKALTFMQEQLVHGQQQVAAQRDELLAKLGSSQPIPVIPSTRDPHSTAPKAPATPEHAIPKPAAGAAAEQFRKLRRDAKRRAIGA